MQHFATKGREKDERIDMSKQVIASKSSVGKSHIFALDGTASLSALSTSAPKDIGTENEVCLGSLFGCCFSWQSQCSFHQYRIHHAYGELHTYKILKSYKLPSPKCQVVPCLCRNHVLSLSRCGRDSASTRSDPDRSACRGCQSLHNSLRYLRMGLICFNQVYIISL